MSYQSVLAPVCYHGNLVSMGTKRRTYSVAEDRALTRLSAERVVGFGGMSEVQRAAFRALERHGWAEFRRWSTGCGWVLVQEGRKWAPGR